jgi:solute carrier family 50 protein (sugar transporter)
MVGNLGVILCVCMFASPLAALKVVLQTRSAKAIPLPFTLASILNCFLWSVAGLFDMHDYAIYVPNLLGLSFGLAQVGLKLVYGSGSSESMLPTKSILTA